LCRVRRELRLPADQHLELARRQQVGSPADGETVAGTDVEVAAPTKVRDAADALRTATLPTVPAPKKCGACDYRGMCTAGRAAAS
jgi:hypothetical protein